MQSPDKHVALPDACYFLTLNVIDKIELFVRPLYKEIIAEALNHFILTQGIVLHAWCLMSSHLHLLLRTREAYGPSFFERDFKKYTTPELIKAVEMKLDFRKEWMLARFEECSKSLKKIEKFQLWESCSSPLRIESDQPRLLLEKAEHIHENPLRENIVELPENYVFSSARDYVGLKGLVNVTVLKPGWPKFKLLSTN